MVTGYNAKTCAKVGDIMYNPEEQWKILIKKYPERAGIAYELYLADKNKTANPTTYFKFAGLRLKQEEVRYQKGLQNYIVKNKPVLEEST